MRFEDMQCSAGKLSRKEFKRLIVVRIQKPSKGELPQIPNYLAKASSLYDQYNLYGQ